MERVHSLCVVLCVCVCVFTEIWGGSHTGRGMGFLAVVLLLLIRRDNLGTHTHARAYMHINTQTHTRLLIEYIVMTVLIRSGYRRPQPYRLSLNPNRGGEI